MSMHIKILDIIGIQWIIIILLVEKIYEKNKNKNCYINQ